MSDTFNFGSNYTLPKLNQNQGSTSSLFNLTGNSSNQSSDFLNFDIGIDNPPAGTNDFDLGFSIDKILGSNNDSSSFLGLDSSTWGGIGKGVGVASDMFSAFNAFQSAQLAKDQFNFQKQAWQDQYDLNLEEYEYQKEKRDARSDAYAAAKASVTKNQL